MPGIAGIVFPDAFQIDHLIAPMLTSLSHRGSPAESRIFKNFQLGTCGSPLVLWEHLLVGLDGHFYGSQLTRATLQENGYPAAGASDSLLIAFAYNFWGTKCLDHLDGDFAFFLLDQKQEKLILARDRIGKKPLYWYQDQKHLIFASELKAVLATGMVPQTPAQDAFASYLYLGYIPQDLSPVQGINKLLPGYYLQYNKDRSKSIQPYWSYSSYFQGKVNAEPSATIQRVDAMLQESVSARIPSQRPIGCSISGGLGSASIAYYLQKLVPHEELHTYSVGFQDETEADVQAAKEVAKHLHLQNKADIITPGTFLNDIVKIAWYLDEPISDPNIVATWRLARLAQPSKFLFSGIGSDELLAGHDRYTKEERSSGYLSTIRQLSMPFLKSLLLPALHLFARNSAYGFLRQAQTNPWQLDYIRQNALFAEDQLKRAAPRLAALFDPHVFLHKFYNLPQMESPIASFLYFDVKTRLSDCYILQYERLTAAHGLDWRAPYLSRNLVEFLASIHTPEMQGSRDTFSILKAILKNALPEPIIQRPKKTRKNLLKTWVELSGLSPLFQLLPKGTLVESGMISGSWLRRQVSSLDKQEESFRYLWSILMLEIWFRLYINGPIHTQPPDISIQELLEKN